jgi:hypothetical protein
MAATPEKKYGGVCFGPTEAAHFSIEAATDYN